jgi:DNA-binding MarR family transcriptional regulator
MTAHNRSRLIERGIGFIVPGNQLYIPELAMDLREHFRMTKSRQGKGLSPVAQAVLFHHLLNLDPKATTPSAIAERLHYSAMSIGRAFDDLVALKLAKTERRGKERHLRFKRQGRDLLKSAHALLRSPVRAIKFVRNVPNVPTLKRAGESALAELTDLSRPKMDVYAVAASDWQFFVKTFHLAEVDENESNVAIETWSYDPAGLSEGPTVDPLSLYAQFSNDRDERVSMAAEELLERLTWL